jgi:hypothetical protein
MRPAVRTAAYVALVAGGTAASVQFWLRALTVRDSPALAPEAVPAIEQRVIPASVTAQLPHPRVGKQGAFVAVVRTPLTTPVRGGAPVGIAVTTSPPAPRLGAPAPRTPTAPSVTGAASTAAPSVVTVAAAAPASPVSAPIRTHGNPHLPSAHPHGHGRGHAYGHDHARATPATPAVPAQPSTPPTRPAVPATPAVRATPPGQAKRGSQAKHGNGHEKAAEAPASPQSEPSESHGNGNGNGNGHGDGRGNGK